jgi:vanillate O-demethylase monooxygenase subunit
MFLRNQWYCAALGHELKDAPLGRIFLNEPVVMYRKPDGALVALEDRCCHRRAPLSKGKVEGENLRCGYHGFLYDAKGRVIWVPGQDKVPPDARVKSYPIVEKHGYVWIWPGDPALADPAEAPAWTWNDDPAWAACSDYLHVNANYLLLVDNLLDLSHVGVLHIKTIGSPEDINPDLTWERGPNWVKGTRIARNLSPSERQKAEKIDFNCDQTKIMHFTPPGNVIIDIMTNEAGHEYGKSGRLHTRLWVLDSMTPETERSCHYFFGLCRDYKIDNQQLTEFMKKSVVTAFLEDVDMLEGEQKIIDLNPDAAQIDVMGDTGGLQARRIVERLLAEEARPGSNRAAAE